MDRIFNMDNKFFTFMSRVADLIILNLLFLVCCIPIVTIGPAITAMYYVTLKMARNEESYIARAFFKSFRENLRQGIAIGLMATVLIFLIITDVLIMRGLSGGIYTVIKYGLAMISLLMVMVLLYAFPILSKFVNTVKNTLRNSLLMALRHLPYTVLMILIAAAPIVAMLFNTTIFVYGVLAYFMLGFSTIALLQSYFLVKIFDNYIPQNEDEEKAPDDWTVEGVEAGALEDNEAALEDGGSAPEEDESAPESTEE